MDILLQEIMPAVLQLASVAVLALIGVATRAVKKWAEEKGLGEKLSNYDYLADLAVLATEQIYKNENGAEKLAKAKGVFLESLPNSAKITNAQLDSFLEAAVKRMNDDWK